MFQTCKKTHFKSWSIIPALLLLPQHNKRTNSNSRANKNSLIIEINSFISVFNMAYSYNNNKNGLCHSKISKATKITAEHDRLTYIYEVYKVVKKTFV